MDQTPLPDVPPDHASADTATGHAATRHAATRAVRIEAALRAAFAPHALAVVDESHRHAGHAGARAGGETHYAVLLVADAFAGQGRVARHRAVNGALAAEFATGLHALSLTLRTPAEVAADAAAGDAPPAAPPCPSEATR